MKTQIRQNVFETNSSSTHSISIAEPNSSDIMDTLFVDEFGNVTLDGGEFGWEWKTFSDAQIKASYLAVYATAWAGSNKEKFIEILKNIIKKQTGCNDVIFNFTTNYDGENWSYIDHQSAESNELHWIFDDEEKIRQFIFNRNSTLETGNDTSGPGIDDYYSDDSDDE